MAYTFVSYSRRDGEFVDRLVEDLRRSGVSIWRDIESILPGQNWIDVIAGAVGQAGALIYVASQNSADSAWMLREVQASLSSRIPIFPIIIDDEAPSRLPPMLRQFQWVDFRRDYGQALQLLLQALPSTVRASIRESAPLVKSKGYSFISYAEEDLPFVIRLRAFMKDRRYAYWDYLESDRDYHTQLFRELQSIIKEASVTLSVQSPAWANSDWTAKEYLYSEAVKVPVLLLVVRKMEPQLVTMGVPYIDFTDSMDEGFAKLDRELRRKGLI